MASKFGPSSFYWKGRRLSETATGDFSHKMAGEDIVTEDGFVDVSDGVHTSDVNLDFSVLRAGNPVKLTPGDRGNVSLSPVNGRVVQIQNATVMEASYSWDVKTGITTGKVVLHGGKPKYIG
jgi:hypothetical protein